jgi:hypothetical protein
VSVITVQLDLQNNLSYIIRTDGEFVPAMPDDDQFSPEQITDHVGGPPEVVCFTPEGYALFRNRDAKSSALPRNDAATLLQQSVSGSDDILGRALLAHPNHIPAFWKSR